MLMIAPNKFYSNQKNQEDTKKSGESKSKQDKTKQSFSSGKKERYLPYKTSQDEKNNWKNNQKECRVIKSQNMQTWIAINSKVRLLVKTTKIF
jgi:hypothetical protein